jgi:hypothetical protein
MQLCAVTVWSSLRAVRVAAPEEYTNTLTVNRLEEEAHIGKAGAAQISRLDFVVLDSSVASASIRSTSL